MSITSRIDPTGFVSVQDSLWHIATSSFSGEVNFKYVFDVHDAAGNQLVRVKNYPDPSNGKGYFDAGNVVRNLIKYNWFEPERLEFADNRYYRMPVINAPNEDTQIAATYQIRVGEDYASGGLQITDLNLSSGTIVAYNYLPKLFGRFKTSIYDKNKKFLTNRPLNAVFDKVQDNHFFIPAAEDIDDPQNPFIDFSIRDINNNEIIGTNTILYYGYNKFWQLDIGVKAINDLNTWLLAESPDNNYFANAYYYQVRWRDETFKFKLICSGNENISLHFINAYGMFETAIFRGANKLNMNVQRKAFEKNDYKYTNSSVDYFDENNIYYESKINYSQYANHSYRLTYEYPDDAEYAWLAELIYSPLIYMEKDGNFYPVTIKNTNYQYNQVKYDRLNNLEIEVEVNQNRKGFLR